MNDIVVMDGGMGQELVRRSPGKADRAWGARVMLDYPEMVVDLHKEFIEAGARIIIVNAYAATRRRLADAGHADDFERLQRRACELALRARDETGVDVTIAGSISPMEFSYRPDKVRPIDVMAERTAEIARLQAPHIDVIITETMSSAEEAVGAVMGAEEAGVPVWVGITVDDTDGTRARSGEPVCDIAAALSDRRIGAWFANCSRPEAVRQAMAPLAAMGAPFGGYANGFEHLTPPTDNTTTADRLAARKDLDPAAYAEHAMAWVAQGATIVGGCCDVGPAHIAAVRNALTDAGHRITKPAV